MRRQSENLSAIKENSSSFLVLKLALSMVLEDDFNKCPCSPPPWTFRDLGNMAVGNV